MRSLRHEAANLTKQHDSWFGSGNRRQSRRTLHTKKRKHFQDDDHARLNTVPIPKRRSNPEHHIVIANDHEVNVSTDLVGVEDRDYLAFIQILKENQGNLDIMEPNDDHNHDEEEVDPDYKMFLENTKQCGFSYVLEMKNANGTSVLVKYEEDKKKPSVDTLNQQKNPIVNAPRKQNNPRVNAPRKQNNPRVNTSRQQNNPRVNIPRQQNKPSLNTLSITTPRQQNQQNFIAKPNVDTLRQHHPKTEPLDNESVRGTSNGHWFLSDCKPGTISNADESYLKFLDHVWVTDDALVYEHENGIVRYDDCNEGIGTDCEQPGRRLITYGNEKSLTPYVNQQTDLDEDDSDCVQILDDTSVKLHYKDKLKTKLRETLQIPFNGKELEEKLKAAQDRKPLERARIMRGRVVSYPTDRTSSSYLDLHPDLAGMLGSADPEKALALLRCLFFYYENVSHQGSFIPWRNPESWLHKMICLCGENINCPMKHHQSIEKEDWAED